MGMSRDYKRPTRSPAKKGGKPMLTGIMIGLFLGLAIALAVALVITRGPSPFVKRVAPAPSAPPATAAKPADKAPGTESQAAAKPRFDFYTILPGSEESVTEQDLHQAEKQAPGSKGKALYFLQAGAFQTEAEADNLKAKLALLGVEASIQTVTLPGKGVWHRVRVGPYSQVEDLDRARSLLAQNGIKTSMVKLLGTAR